MQKILTVEESEGLARTRGGSGETEGQRCEKAALVPHAYASCFTSLRLRVGQLAMLLPPRRGATVRRGAGRNGSNGLKWKDVGEEGKFGWINLEPGK